MHTYAFMFWQANFFFSLSYASVTLSQFGSTIRPDLEIGVDRVSVWVSHSKVWIGRGKSG